jgi:hypothetical protein
MARLGAKGRLSQTNLFATVEKLGKQADSEAGKAAQIKSLACAALPLA